VRNIKKALWYHHDYVRNTQSDLRFNKNGGFSLLIKEIPETMEEYVEHTQNFDDKMGIFTINIINNVGSGTWQSLSGKKKNVLKSFKLMKNN
jgi:hypothetical protein